LISTSERPNIRKLCLWEEHRRENGITPVIFKYQFKAPAKGTARQVSCNLIAINCSRATCEHAAERSVSHRHFAASSGWPG
jgi:hypothetical protein